MCWKLWKLLAALIVAACASEVVRTPVEISAASAERYFVTAAPAEIQLDSGFKRTIAKDTMFIEFGTIPQGKVLKPTHTTFTIEAKHMHEAYPVLIGERIVGFYLPAERAFSPLTQTTSLSLR
jgi:hypothetical protein